MVNRLYWFVGSCLAVLAFGFNGLSRAAENSAGSVFPFVLPWNDASPGVTDLSGWLHQPAGKHGAIRVGSDGHFYAGQERIRFLGVNLSFAGGLPQKADADKLAARFAKFGINVVRFHHLDTRPYPEGILRGPVKGTNELNLTAQDRLRFFVAQLKRRGIYANINLLVGRPFAAAEGLPAEIEKMDWKDQHLVGFFNARHLELQQAYASQLLTRVNSYTGLTLAEDPAVAFVEINNEQGLVHGWLGNKLDSLPEIFLLELQQRWNTWLKKRYNVTAKLHESWGETQFELGQVPVLPHKGFSQRPASVQSDWLTFLWETEDQYWQAMYRFLKDDLKVKGLITGTIVGCSTPSLQAKMDWVDTHSYWQHPRFPGRSWDPANWIVENRSMVNEKGGTIPGLALRRVAGKPHAVTEYNHAAPNTYGSEGFLLLAAYAALQDWDALYVYSYAHSRSGGWDGRTISSFFDIDQHPTKMATLVPAAAMFLRGDVQVARQLITATMDRQQEIELLPKARSWDLVHAGTIGLPREAALLHRVALVTEGRTNAGMAAPKIEGKRYAADTGELVWDLSRANRGLVTIDTPRSKAVIGFGGGQTFDLGGIRIQPGEGLQNGWSAITLTDMAKPGAAPRWLITATGYAENTGMQWKNPEKTTVGRDWGQAPSRIEGVSAQIRFPVSAGQLQAWALDERGQRKSALNVTSVEDKAAIQIGPQAQTLWYEVELK